MQAQYLTSVSLYFNNILNGRSMESKTRSTEIKDVTPATFAQFLEWLNGRKLHRLDGCAYFNPVTTRPTTRGVALHIVMK
jgi:hypothetical protein